MIRIGGIFQPRHAVIAPNRIETSVREVKSDLISRPVHVQNSYQLLSTSTSQYLQSKSSNSIPFNTAKMATLHCKLSCHLFNHAPSIVGYHELGDAVSLRVSHHHSFFPFHILLQSPSCAKLSKLHSLGFATIPKLSQRSSLSRLR